jgi:large subunit ribosomal protein L32
MAVPKRKMSRSNTRHRRARWKAAAPALSPCPCPRREMIPSHRACTHCGLYRGRQVTAPTDQHP